jgi:hypothetical protein
LYRFHIFFDKKEQLLSACFLFTARKTFDCGVQYSPWVWSSIGGSGTLDACMATLPVRWRGSRGWGDGDFHL